MINFYRNYQEKVFNALLARNINPGEFMYENMYALPLEAYMSPFVDYQLNEIATDPSLMGSSSKRMNYIKGIMTSIGFKRMGGGTNRIIYRHLEDDRIVAKVAMDKIGIEANKGELITQHYIKPYCAKTFYTSPSGAVAISERVMPLMNADQFYEIWYEAYLVLKLIMGKYVFDDIGNEFFLNWGIRPGFGPVILDYPYIYPLDGNKLYCNKVDDDGHLCGGFLDYDFGFNYITCTKCGKRYYARDLVLNNKENKPIMKKGACNTMVVQLTRGDKVITSSARRSDVIKRPDCMRQSDTSLRVSFRKGSEIIVGQKPDNEPHPPKGLTLIENTEAVVEQPKVVEEQPPIQEEEAMTPPTEVVEENPPVEEVKQEEETTTSEAPKNDDSDLEHDPIEDIAKNRSKGARNRSGGTPKRNKNNRDNKGRFISSALDSKFIPSGDTESEY